MRERLTAIVLCCLIALPAYASDAPLNDVPYAQQLGAGRFIYMHWDIYDARLYAPHGIWNGNPPYALTLHYLRSLKGSDIADHTIKRMRNQGYADEEKLALWRAQMLAIFPDVSNGTELTAAYTSKHSTVFYEGSKRIGVIQDAAFGKQFFDIWLSDKTSEPALRKKLLGLP